MEELFQAITNGDTQLVEKILESGEIDVTNLYTRRITPLIYASYKSDKKIIQLLLDYGSDIEQKDVEGFTALFEAVRWSKTENVRLLLENGASPNIINVRSLYENTPLIIASMDGNIEIVKLLVQCGGKTIVNTKNKQGRTALMYASFYGYIEIVELLLKNGAAENINDENEDGCTALMRACNRGYTKIVKLLLENGANTSDDNGKKALEHVVKNCFCFRREVETCPHQEIISLFLSKKKSLES